jgi:hypothetical protein
MTDLTDLLERTAAHTPVGEPPLDALYAGAARRRRRRTVVFTAGTALAVGAVIVGANALTSATPNPPVTSPTPAPTTATGPYVLRMVAFGHAAITVPAEWPINKSQCGTPKQDTLQIDDPTRGQFCQSDRPKGVESVQLTGAPPSLNYHADETIVIDGVRAERQRTRCLNGWQGTRVCMGTVGIPSLKVWFHVESSTSAAEVDRLLDRIHILRDWTGVPSYASVGGGTGNTLAKDYAPRLAVAGLKPVYRQVKSPSYPSGTILGVSPGVGTLLGAAGGTVTVTVAK